VLEEPRQLLPLPVGTRITQLAGKLLKIRQGSDLLPEIGDGASCRCLVDQLFL
jgi:hypothetical protein